MTEVEKLKRENIEQRQEIKKLTGIGSRTSCREPSTC
jgi:hypothetical protein